MIDDYLVASGCFRTISTVISAIAQEAIGDRGIA